MKWQPIDSPPEKTGWCLIWCDPGECDSGTIGVASCEYRTRDGEGEQLPMEEWKWAFGLFQPLNFVPQLTLDKERSASATPTHWAPLPEPPSD